jgi:hypothetical protein
MLIRMATITKFGQFGKPNLFIRAHSTSGFVVVRQAGLVVSVPTSQNDLTLGHCLAKAEVHPEQLWL